MLCAVCQSYFSTFAYCVELCKGKNGVDDAEATCPLHANLEDLSICADQGKCQFCMVVNFSARSVIPHLDRFSLKTLRILLKPRFYSPNSSPGAVASLYFDIQEYKSRNSSLSEDFKARNACWGEASWIDSLGQLSLGTTWPEFHLFQDDRSNTRLLQKFPAEFDNSTTSEFCFGLASKWLSKCHSTHTLCNEIQFNASDQNSELVLPTRLIDVGTDNRVRDPRLIETANVKLNGAASRYVALSYRWGKSPPLTTTRKTITKRKSAIPLSSMPRTIRDAVIITRRLGVRYIWIDAMCIIQGDAADWKAESLRMQDVYRFAYVTISAAASTGTSSGFFSSRSGQIYRAIPLAERQDTNNPLFNSYLEPRAIFTTPGNDSLFTRGWVLQEQLLYSIYPLLAFTRYHRRLTALRSPRSLVYGQFGLRWECVVASGSEGRPILRDYPPFNPSSSRINNAESIIMNGLQNIIYKPKRIGSSNNNFLFAWRHIAENFSRRSLTNQKDKLPALAGIATTIGRISSMTYMGGIWKEELWQGLLWEVDRKDSASAEDIKQYGRPTWVAPSWSWVSVSEPIRWLYKDKYKSVIDIIDINDCDSVLSSRGSITLSGKGEKKVIYHTSPNEEWHRGSYPFRIHEIYSFIADGYMEGFSDVLLFYISMDTERSMFSKRENENLTALVLSGSNGSYRRVGVVERVEMFQSEFNRLETMKITIY